MGGETGTVKGLKQLKSKLEFVLSDRPTNQVLKDFLVEHLAEIDKIIEQETQMEKYIVKIDTRKKLSGLLVEKDVKKIAANILRIDVADINSGIRKKEVVCARWLVIYYFETFAQYTRHQQGAIVSVDHSTAVNAVHNIQYFTGWRKHAKVSFEKIVNEIHKTVEIEKMFK